MKRPSGRVLAVLLLAAAVFAAWFLLPLPRLVEQLQERVRDMGVLGGLLYGAVYVVAVLLLVPGSVLTLGAGAAFGLLWGSLLAWLAATTAAGLAFLIARYLARERAQRAAARNERFRALERAVREEGFKVVALLRLSPLIPFSLSNYFYGLTPVPFGPYLLASAVGMLPGTLLYVSLGAAGRALAGGGEKSPLEWALLAGGLLATVLATVLLGRRARRHLEAEGANA